MIIAACYQQDLKSEIGDLPTYCTVYSKYFTLYLPTVSKNEYKICVIYAGILYNTVPFLLC
jgi:hypothetical protein